MKLLDWVKLPTGWIEAGGLKRLRWQVQHSDATAALMILVCLAHCADQTNGVGKATYNLLAEATGLSRTKISAALSLLEKLELIEREPEGRSTYALKGFATKGWGKLPARRLYTSNAIIAFRNFHLRSYIELNALKLYLLVVTRRDNKTNLAHMTYDQISDYSGIDQARIRSAISFLAANGLLHVERLPSAESEYGTANAYRLVYIDSHRHMGTSGRAADTSFPEFFTATRDVS